MARRRDNTDDGPVRVPVGEFRTQLSRFLRRARAGETFVLEERGRPIARLEMPSRPLTAMEKIRRMIKSGEAHWSGRRFTPPDVPVHVAAGTSVADIIIEDRRGRPGESEEVERLRG